VVLWHFLGDAADQIISGIEQANPTITIKAESYGYDQAHSRLAGALASGSGAPDVFLTDLQSLGSVLAQPGLADLGAAPFDAAQLRADVVPSVWDVGSVDGRQLAMPWNLGVGAAWYRADTLEAAGLPTDPEAVREQAGTWDGWLALDQALRRANAEAALIAESLPLFGAAVAQQGWGWVDRGKLLVEERGVPAAELLQRLHEQDIPAQISNSERGRGMAAGTMAGMVEPSWTLLFLAEQLPQSAGKWRLARVPGGDFLTSGLFFVIPQQSQRQEAAWTFVRYLCATAAGQNTTFQASGALPAFRPAWSDPLYDRPVEFFGGQPAFRLLAEAAASLPPTLVSRHDLRIADAASRQAQTVATGVKTPQEAMADAERGLLGQLPDLSA
jgi:ABC-type glycerol-3-phosphate transport system substrate-binding protein